MATPEEFDVDDLQRRMDGALTAFKTELSGLRTGRASAGLLDPIVVEVYGGSKMPINQLGTVSVPDARMISIQVWDKSTVGAVDKAIQKSGLGLNPQVDGTLIRIPIPALNAERRTELTKVAGKYAEEARVAVRHVRRHGLDDLKRMEKDGHIGEDDHKIWAEEIQEMTDAVIKQIDQALSVKETEITNV